MTSPLPYLIRMLLFLAVVAGLAGYLHEDLLRVFNNTPGLDAVILGALAIGIFFIFRQVILLWPEVSWLRRFQHRDENTAMPPSDRINLLAPMAAMLGERPEQFRLSPTATRALLDGIATRLDERRELARYLIGLLIFLGLLGTFWGLLQTIGAVADAINGLQATAGDAITMFAKLKGSIEGPLKGMSTAFGASLFGLSGSLVLGFLELQASQAQGRFHIELEEWLARATSIPAMPAEPVGGSVPAYVEALLERNAEGLDGLTRTLQRIEESRQAAAGTNADLIHRLASLAETMRTQQNLLARFTELSIEMRSAVNRLGDRSGSEADREALAAHQRNVEAQFNRLIEEEVRSRVALSEELRGAFSKISDRAADEADREALIAKQQEVEQQVARLAEQTAQSSSEVAAEVKQAMEKLAGDGARQQADLIAELRSLAARVADRAAAEADRETLLAHQREIEGKVGQLGEGLRTATQQLGALATQGSGHQELLDQQRSVEAKVAQLAEELRAIGASLAARPVDGGSEDREALVAQQKSIEGQIATLADELRAAMARVADRPAASDAERESLQIHQRNVEAFLARLTEENARARAQLTEELNNAISRMPDRAMAEADRESLASHQRNIEGHLSRLVEENTRNRAALVDALREAIGRLSERFADNDREAVAAHQRNIETHLARLAEEASHNRTALADELRGEIRLLARTLAIARKGEG